MNGAKTYVICVRCGDGFGLYPSMVKYRTYCSEKCRRAATATQQGKEITPSVLRELLDYDVATGIFTWRVNQVKNTKGQRAGGPAARGYRCICLYGKRYKEHRLAWLYVHGVWPGEQIDHRDLNKTNNAIGNLREATNAQNQWNTTGRANAAVNLKGVFAVGRNYGAGIRAAGKYVWLGTFSTTAEAKQAYDAAAREHFGEFARS